MPGDDHAAADRLGRHRFVAATPPPFTGNEGTPIPLDASALGWAATPDTREHVVDRDRHQRHARAPVTSPRPGRCRSTPTARSRSSTAICPNEGEYVARVDGWDVEGKGSFDNDVDFFVHNAPPAVTIDTPVAGHPGRPSGRRWTLSATVTDPGVDDTVTCEISWGDGTTEAGTLTAGTCTGTHTYASAGETRC